MSSNIAIPTNYSKYNGSCTKCGRDIEDYFIHYRVDAKNRTAIAEYVFEVRSINMNNTPVMATVHHPIILDIFPLIQRAISKAAMFSLN
jgi:hypothetical protein